MFLLPIRILVTKVGPADRNNASARAQIAIQEGATHQLGRKSNEDKPLVPDDDSQPRSALHVFKNFPARRGECEEEGEWKILGNERRREDATGACTLGMQPAPPTEPRRVHLSTQWLSVTRRGGQVTRRLSPLPVTGHRVDYQPPMLRVPPREGKPHHPQEGPCPVTSPIRPYCQSTSLPPSYASIVTRSRSNKMKNSATHGRWQLVKRRRPSTPERHPINPSMEGRCCRCLARDHQARTCREPVWCRLYHQAGHRQYACPRAKREATSPEPPQRATSGLYACLIGEIIDAYLTWTQIV